MKIVGLITEYNPFHNGHLYHLLEAKRVTGADYVVIVMSGNFVQRGTPAMIDKYSRTRMALNNGADLVIELPVCYATGSAEYFALGAVSILDKLGIVDYLCFGSEAGELSEIKHIASVLLKEKTQIQKLIAQHLKEGITYPAARAKALAGMVNQINSSIPIDEYNLLMKPNNILGIEYCKALDNLNSKIQPITIQRIKAEYHDKDLAKNPITQTNGCSSHHDNFLIEDNKVINSATAIRNHVTEHNNSYDLTIVGQSVPKDVYLFLKEHFKKLYPITEEDFSILYKYKLLLEDVSSLASYVDISDDLADRLKNNIDLNCTMDQMIQQIKTKNFTLTRINRALLHMLLNISKEKFDEFNQNGYSGYARILGIKKSASHMLKEIKNLEKIPVITKVSNASKVLDPLSMQMLQADIFAAHLYNQIVYEKYGTVIENEYRHGMIIQ